MIAGGYTIDLYCDNEPCKWQTEEPLRNDYCASIYGTDERDCKRQARRKWWRLTRDDKAICPYCTGKREAKPQS